MNRMPLGMYMPFESPEGALKSLNAGNAEPYLNSGSGLRDDFAYFAAAALSPFRRSLGAVRMLLFPIFVFMYSTI